MNEENAEDITNRFNAQHILDMSSEAEVLAMLTDDEMTKLLGNLLEFTEGKINTDLLTKCITFDNCNLIAYNLANGVKKDVAVGLSNELAYWVKED